MRSYKSNIFQLYRQLYFIHMQPVDINDLYADMLIKTMQAPDLQFIDVTAIYCHLRLDQTIDACCRAKSHQR